jgi:hypothetical protein
MKLVFAACHARRPSLTRNLHPLVGISSTPKPRENENRAHPKVEHDIFLSFIITTSSDYHRAKGRFVHLEKMVGPLEQTHKPVLKRCLKTLRQIGWSRPNTGIRDLGQRECQAFFRKSAWVRSRLGKYLISATRGQHSWIISVTSPTLVSALATRVGRELARMWNQVRNGLRRWPVRPASGMVHSDSANDSDMPVSRSILFVRDYDTKNDQLLSI